MCIMNTFYIFIEILSDFEFFIGSWKNLSIDELNFKVRIAFQK